MWRYADVDIVPSALTSLVVLVDMLAVWVVLAEDECSGMMVRGCIIRK